MWSCECLWDTFLMTMRQVPCHLVLCCLLWSPAIHSEEMFALPSTLYFMLLIIIIVVVVHSSHYCMLYFGRISMVCGSGGSGIFQTLLLKASSAFRCRHSQRISSRSFLRKQMPGNGKKFITDAYYWITFGISNNVSFLFFMVGTI